MENMLKELQAKNERTAKRKIHVRNGFIGMLLIAAILITILLINSNVAIADKSSEKAGNAVVTSNPGQLQEQDTAINNQNKVLKKMDLNKQRRAAADRLKAARPKAAISKVAPGAAGALALPLALPIGMDWGIAALLWSLPQLRQ